jgi:hypothetical protein
MHMRNPEMKAWHSALALAIGILGALVGLYLAIHVVGPVVRTLLGVPWGFNEDHPTREAWLQARAVQLLSLGATFFLIGLASGVAKYPKSLARILWAANPFSVGLAYWFCQRLWSANGPGEYFGYAGLGLLALIAPFVLAPCALLGNRIGRHLQPADGSGFHNDAPA